MKTKYRRRKTYQITITEKCNLKCIYCYEKDKDTRFLPAEKIKSIIKDAFADSEDWDELEFDFHGGEIALAFTTLKEACEWLWSRPWPKPYLCFACTNGTLIHGEIQQWFCRNRKRFYLGISLDGTKEMHDTNRSRSYDKIDFEFFRRCWPEQPVKMTISPQTLPALAAGMKHIVSLGFRYSANLAYGVEWTDELLEIYRRELAAIAEFYLANPELELPNLLSMSMKAIGLYQAEPERRKERKKWCGSGDGMICYGCDGKTYPCQLFMPSSSNTEGENILEKLDFSNIENFEDEECAGCPIRDVCPTCYGSNYLSTGTLHKRPKDLCKFRKMEALAASYIQGKMLLEPKKYAFTRDFTDYEIKLTAMGVRCVQTELT